MQSIRQDVRYALRQLRKSPGFAVTVIAVLALGIGANIAVFTMLNGIFLRPLLFEHPDRVVAIELAGPMPFYTLTYANMLQLRDAAGSDLKIGALLYGGNGGNASVVGPGGRVQVSRAEVTAGLFDMLGVRPILGRTFRGDENQPGRNQVVVIGEDVWRKLFLSDPGVIGKTVAIRQKPYTVIGVLPRGFQFSSYDEMAVWTPEELVPANQSDMTGKQSKFGFLYARLPEGMSAGQLAANLSRTQAVVAREVPDQNLPKAVKVTTCRQQMSGDARKPLCCSTAWSSASGPLRALT